MQQLAKRLNIPEFSRGPRLRETSTRLRRAYLLPAACKATTPAPSTTRREEEPNSTPEDVETIQPEAQAEIEEQLQAEIDESEVLNFRPVAGQGPDTLAAPAGSKVADADRSQGNHFSVLGVLAYHISLVVYRTAKRYIQHRDHGFTATVVEETLREFYMADFGAWVWAGMKDTAEHMWSTNLGLKVISFMVGGTFSMAFPKCRSRSSRWSLTWWAIAPAPSPSA